MNAVDHAISYLYRTRNLAIEYSATKKPIFQYTSNTAFADNPDRKSSDGYLLKLYSSPINWTTRK